MTKYLYGASIQGIQNFIFQTNKLVEIAGASELVEQICTEKFRTIAGIKEDDAGIILSAAGNIKYIFTDKTACERFVKLFPKTIMEMAAGITISQAVVSFEGELDKTAMQNLEKRLRIQRNKSIQIPSANLMVSEIARRTGGAGVKYVRQFGEEEVIDLAQEQKRQMADSANRSLLSKVVGKQSHLIAQFPFEVDDIATKDTNNWLAVIHADGNNLGQKIIEMVSKLEAHQTQKAMKALSKILEDSTTQAAKTAFDEVVGINNKSKKLPFRPVILGGDDLTAIIRGDLAMDFTRIFLEKFEIYTKANFKDFAKTYEVEDLFGNGLTACAGIAYIKVSYPFHYGVKLSESLCKEAKNKSKLINETHTPSSCVFHKVHASFVEDYEDIVATELSTKTLQFNYGPYFIQPQTGYSTIENLQNQVKSINQKDAPKSGLRTWLTEVKNNPEKAEQLLKRIKSLNPKYADVLGLYTPYTERDTKKYTPIFDIISLSNIQKTDKNG